MTFARTARALGLSAFVAGVLAACGGGIAPDGSSSNGSSSGGSSGSSGNSTTPCPSNPSGGPCAPTPPPPKPLAREPKVHRATATDCSTDKPAENPSIPDGGTGPMFECHSNAECTSGRNGRCDGNGHDGYRCTYDACYTDSECGGGVCACNGASRATNHVCLAGGCRTDSDCGSTGYCSPTLGSCGHYGKAEAYYCHTSEDECVDDEDCAGAGTTGQTGYCAYQKTVGHWKCSTSECAG